MRTFFIGLLIVVVLSGTAVVGWSYYQNSVSWDLRRTLTTAARPDCSLDDISAYVRTARLQVRTRRDKELEGELEHYEHVKSILAVAKQTWALGEESLREDRQECDDDPSGAQCQTDIDGYQRDLDDLHDAESTMTLVTNAVNTAYAGFRADLQLPHIPDQN